MDQKTITHDILRSTNIYLTLYLLIFAVSILLISLDNFDMTTNFTAVTATLNNIGPGLEIVGPMGNFSSFSYFLQMCSGFRHACRTTGDFPTVASLL